MPILKTDILGTLIEINYEEVEKVKLVKLINKFKQRLSEFVPNGKINNNAILFLAALKLEDELEENKKILLKNNLDKNIIDDQAKEIIKLNNQIIYLKNEAEEIKSKNVGENYNNLLILEEVQNLEKLTKFIQEKIKNEINR